MQRHVQWNPNEAGLFVCLFVCLFVSIGEHAVFDNDASWGLGECGEPVGRLGDLSLARLRTDGGLLAASESVENGDGGLGSEIFVEVVIDLHHRSIDAGAETLDLGESEELVGRGLADLDAEALLDGVENVVGALNPCMA
jgi:hypothetical protein